MSFVYPAFLAALISVAIPIIIHLFNFRRFKTVYFPDIRFLKQIKIEKQTQNRLKHLLVLACRILAIACLVLAFALPFLKNQSNGSEDSVKSISVFVDNSFSMEQVDENGTLFEGALLRANDILKAYGPADKFQVISEDFEAKHQHLLNKDAVQKELDALKISPSSQGLDKILKRQDQALSDGGALSKDIYILSDFQNHMLDKPLKGLDSNAHVFLVPLKANPASNVYIDSCWFATPITQPGTEAELKIRLVNNSKDNREAVPVKLSLNGVQKALTSVSIGAGQSSTSSLKFKVEKAGYYQAVIKITDFPVVYDDAFFFSFSVASKIKVLCVYEGFEPKSISALFKSDEGFSYQTQALGSIKYDELKNNDLVILHQLKQLSSGLIQEISSFAKSGHSVLVVPSQSIDLPSYNSLFSELQLPSFSAPDSTLTKVKSIEYQSLLYKYVFTTKDPNVDLPIIKFHYPAGANGSAEKLLGLANGDSYLLKASTSNSYVLCSPLDERSGNLTKHALFVPTFYNIGLNSVHQNEPYQEISENNHFDLMPPTTKSETSVKVVGSQGFAFIPEQTTEDNKLRINIHGQIKKAGNYWVMNGTDTIGNISLNFSRNESDLNFVEEPQLKKWMEDAGVKNFEIFQANTRNLTNSISELRHGSKLWKSFLFAALCLLLLEVLLLRFWKT
jgi:hypothetical protein